MTCLACRARLDRYENHANYRGTACIDCGWDASYHPPEVRRCLQCDGELVVRIARDALDQEGKP